jgi:stringent starvation protein B
LGRNSTCTILRNKLTPTIIIAIESNRPAVPESVMSPNPVVVSVATVK